MQRRLVTLAVLVSTFLAAMDTMVVGTAMPTIIGALGGLGLYSWVFSSYLLTSTVTMPLYGKLADLHGRKPMFLFGTALFLGGSALCGLAQSMEQMIAFRALQGLGAGAVLPITITIVGDLYPLEQRARMMGVFAAIWGVASVVGPALGGFITDHLSWRWVFFINLPLGAASLLLVGLALRERVEPSHRALDLPGVASLSAGVVALLLGLQLGGRELAWPSWPVVALLGVAAGCLALFARVESRAAEPLLPAELLRHYVIGPANATGFLIGAALFGLSSFVPAYVQGVLGGTASTAGGVLTALSIGWTVGSVAVGRLLLRLGYRAMAGTGLGLIMAGAALLSALGEAGDLARVLASAGLVGLGMGFSSTSTVVAVQNAVPWSQRGTATSANQFFRSIGGTLGVSLVGAVFGAALAGHLARLGLGAEALAAASALLDPQARAGVPAAMALALRGALAGALQVVFLVNVGIAALGLAAALRLPGGRAEAHAWSEARERAAAPR